MTPTGKVTADKRYVRKSAGCILSDYKTNLEVVNHLKVTPVLGEIENAKMSGWNMLTEWQMANYLKSLHTVTNLYVSN